MTLDETINYSRISQAQFYYRALNYRNIQTPWTVTTQAIRATLPIGCRMMESVTGVLVGSGEQGFIQQMMNGELEPGKYQTTTPCFRDEKVYNELTRPYFMKVELIWYMPDDPRAAYEKVLNDAMSCFFQISDVETFDAVQTDQGFDIYYHGIELGSYGVRKMDKHVWVYGTGLAEPRFSLALKTPAPVVEQEAVVTESEEPIETPTPLQVIPFPIAEPHSHNGNGHFHIHDGVEHTH